jgi:hypothetical protein
VSEELAELFMEIKIVLAYYMVLLPAHRLQAEELVATIDAYVNSKQA